MLCCVNYIECWDIQYLFVSGIDMVDNKLSFGAFFLLKQYTFFLNSKLDSVIIQSVEGNVIERKVSQMQTTLSATVARTNCMLCMDFRKAPDKPIATTRIKYFISADFFFLL